MATKADFNAEEWSTLVEAPLLAGLRVVAAERGGMIRESVAMGRVYAEARRAHGESELLDALVASPPGVDRQGIEQESDIRAVAEERLGEAVRLVSEKGSAADAEAYRRFVLDVARAAAEAHKEGGFIGIGGRKVSDAEQAAIDEIARVVGAEPPA